MYQRKLSPDIRCPLEFGLAAFGGRWRPRVICVLAAHGVLRYAEIRREMTNISDAVLGATLKDLLASGIISREQYNEVPPRVEYRLTEKGRSIVPILQDICRWAGQYERRQPDGIVLAQCERCDFGFGGHP